MNEHPIEGLMVTAMNSIREMVDVDTIIGEPIETSNNIIIIPISKVGFGFAAGGSEFNGETINEYKKADKEEEIQYKLPFGGGSGAGVSITPIAFLVVQGGNVKLLPVSHSSAIDRLLDYVPDLMEKANNLLNKQMNNKKEEKKDEERKFEKRRREEKEEDVIKKEKNFDSNTIIFPNSAKVHPKKNKAIKYEFEYDETPEIYDVEENINNEDEYDDQ